MRLVKCERGRQLDLDDFTYHRGHCYQCLAFHLNGRLNNSQFFTDKIIKRQKQTIDSLRMEIAVAKDTRVDVFTLNIATVIRKQRKEIQELKEREDAAINVVRQKNEELTKQVARIRELELKLVAKQKVIDGAKDIVITQDKELEELRRKDKIIKEHQDELERKGKRIRQLEKNSAFMAACSTPSVTIAQGVIKKRDETIKIQAKQIDAAINVIRQKDEKLALLRDELARKNAQIEGFQRELKAKEARIDLLLSREL